MGGTAKEGKGGKWRSKVKEGGKRGGEGEGEKVGE